ncbi:hypothetical protein [Streptomyces longisporoflavus]|uniref:Uncharacterized protein n=1 Tax=Streptomyces longisporoflavus TaxID=28044 RepID=A0ABW7QW61_9ACTN
MFSSDGALPKTVPSQNLDTRAENRPAGSNNLFVAWETLTHANNPG